MGKVCTSCGGAAEPSAEDENKSACCNADLKDEEAPAEAPAEGGDAPAEGGDAPAEGGDAPAEGGDAPAEGGEEPQ